MTASITIAFDYSDNEVVERTGGQPGPPPDPKWLRITVEGERAITQMFLPTIPLESLTDANWGNWITTIQGPIMGRCGVTATQRQLLLNIALVYHAFSSGTAAVPDIWYTNFIRTLINIARSHANETIDGALVYLTSALRVLLPLAIFDSPDIPPVTHDPEPPIPVVASREARGSAQAPAPSTLSVIAEPASESDGTLPIPVASLDEVYSAVLCRSANESYDSDSETLPSLCTVYNSSDGDDE